MSKKKGGLFLKWVLYGLLALLLCLWENTWYALGLETALSLLPLLSAMTGFYEGAVGGACFGILCGLLSDAAGGASLWLSPTVFALFGCLAGLCGKNILRRGFFTFCTLTLAASGAYAVLRLIAALFYTRFDFTVFRFGIVPCVRNALASFAVGLLLYLPVRLLSLLGRDQTRKVPSHRARLIGGKTEN